MFINWNVIPIYILISTPFSFFWTQNCKGNVEFYPSRNNFTLALLGDASNKYHVCTALSGLERFYTVQKSATHTQPQRFPLMAIGQIK